MYAFYVVRRDSTQICMYVNILYVNILVCMYIHMPRIVCAPIHPCILHMRVCVFTYV